jgi:peptidoglycan-associated lipoprotein
MKRNIFIIGALVLICSFSFVFITGCAKTPETQIMKDTAATQAEQDKAAAAAEAAALAAEKAALEEQMLQEKLLAEADSFKDIRFAFDKYDLSPEARGVLSKLADWLNANQDFEVTIEGHCDERGTTEYNLALGERRAEAAKAYLTNLGVDTMKITTISYGEELPMDPASNEEAWAKNRRDHFVVFSKK